MMGYGIGGQRACVLNKKEAIVNEYSAIYAYNREVSKQSQKVLVRSINRLMLQIAPLTLLFQC